MPTPTYQALLPQLGNENKSVVKLPRFHGSHPSDEGGLVKRNAFVASGFRLHRLKPPDLVLVQLRRRSSSGSRAQTERE